MEYKEFWSEGMDEKRFALRIAKRVWIILAAALAGALFAGGMYLMVRLVTQGPTRYQTQVLYAIRYNVHEEDEILKEFINEYNAYTWGDMMRSDKVMEIVMEQLPDLDRSFVESSVSTSIASDPEFLEAQFTTEDAACSDRIAAAFGVAMPIFGESLRERGLTAIEVWKTEEAGEVVPENKVKNAAALGLVLGALAGAAVLAVWYVLDDSLLTRQDLDNVAGWMREQGMKEAAFWGYRTTDSESAWNRQLAANMSYQANKAAFREVALEHIMGGDTDWELLRETPAVLFVRWGRESRRLLCDSLAQLHLQDVEVVGIVLTEADARFLDLYYGKKEAGGRR